MGSRRSYVALTAGPFSPSRPPTTAMPVGWMAASCTATARSGDTFRTQSISSVRRRGRSPAFRRGFATERTRGTQQPPGAAPDRSGAAPPVFSGLAGMASAERPPGAAPPSSPVRAATARFRVRVK